MEVKTIIANKNVVKKVAPKEGKTIQVGNARLTWKAMGVDTAYGTSLYEMDLAPGVGIPAHSHPYAEIFYVIKGFGVDGYRNQHIDFPSYQQFDTARFGIGEFGQANHEEASADST
jgi:hypothetical protein